MPPLHIETPLIESRALSACPQRRVWLKMEALQPPGSFKLRGIGHACQEYIRRGAARFRLWVRSGARCLLYPRKRTLLSRTGCPLCAKSRRSALWQRTGRLLGLSAVANGSPIE